MRLRRLTGAASIGLLVGAAGLASDPTGESEDAAVWEAARPSPAGDRATGQEASRSGGAVRPPTTPIPTRPSGTAPPAVDDVAGDDEREDTSAGSPPTTVQDVRTSPPAPAPSSGSADADRGAVDPSALGESPSDPRLTPPTRSTGRPGPHNTGVPEGTALTVHHGDIVVTTPGTVLDGLDIHGFVTVRAADVTIRRSVIRGREVTSYRGLVVSDTDESSVLIEDVELVPTYPSGWIDGMRGWNITARRVDVHRVIDAVHVYGPNVTVEDSWLHDNAHFEDDPARGGEPSHDDSIQIQKGHSIVIRNNTIMGARGAGIMLTQGLGEVSNVSITGNYLDGGGCTINFSEKDRGPFDDVSIEGNVFGRNTLNPDCAIVAPSSTASVLSVTGNAFIDGRTVKVRSGD